MRGADVAGFASVIALSCMVTLPFLNPVHSSPLPTFWQEVPALAFGLAAIVFLALSRQISQIAIPVIALWTAGFGIFLLMQPIWTAAPYAEPAWIAGLYALWASGIMWSGANLRTFRIETTCT